MKKYSVILWVIIMPFSFSISSAEVISCPSETQGVITNHDQWEFHIQHKASYSNIWNSCSGIFSPPLTIQDTGPGRCANGLTSGYKWNLKTMSFTFDHGGDVHISSSHSMTLICNNTKYTAQLEANQPAFAMKYNPNTAWPEDGTITAQRTLTNYSYCMPLDTVPVSFDCK